jgi:hypothetical protein
MFEIKNYRDSNPVLIHPAKEKQTRNASEVKIYRGSKFRGASINGQKWQVFYTLKNKKYYIGQLSSELLAARLYDEFAIVHEGLNAETNFEYTCREIEKISENFFPRD